MSPFTPAELFEFEDSRHIVESQERRIHELEAEVQRMRHQYERDQDRFDSSKRLAAAVRMHQIHKEQGDSVDGEDRELWRVLHELEG